MIYLNWPPSIDAFLQLLDEVDVGHKTQLLNEGDIATKLFFIRKGCLRVYFNDDGREITTQFFVENQSATSIDSFLNQIPSQFAIDCLEPCRVAVLTKKQFDLAMEESSFQLWFYQTAFQKLISHTNRLLSFIKDSPQQRYQFLIQQHPDLLGRIPQHYIASYLGITPVSLSRIKNRK